MKNPSSQMLSPNTKVRPVTAAVNDHDHLVIGGCDTVELAGKFGTPLWVLDEKTIEQSVKAILAGLIEYPDARVLYAGKAFLCLAMCRLVSKLGLGLDVVSPGELYTAVHAGFAPEQIYMHGNNKTQSEIRDGLCAGGVTIVVDNRSDLEMVAKVAAQLGRRARVLLRVTPGVVPDTHHYIRTGHTDSKFGLPIDELAAAVELALKNKQSIELAGLHAHIGSQSHEIEPYLEIVDILAGCFQDLKQWYAVELSELDVGGGLGIAYLETDRIEAIFDWASKIAAKVTESFGKRALRLPRLTVEPGRSIVGTAGITLYRAGHAKELPGGLRYLALDGGMADNPRPITYQAQYTACLASRMSAKAADKPVTLAGKYCESGDIIIKDTYLDAQSGDLIAVFGTGAYNYSMASNYNRTGRPACLLVGNGQADVIIERETNADLLRQDRVPARLLKVSSDI